MNPDSLHLHAQAPWPGPAAYGERDAAFFCGRTGETNELLRLVRAETVCVLFGLSGLGKTSLLQAGLFPRLREEGYLPVRIRLDHSLDAVPPVQQLLTEVARAARAQSIAAPGWDAGEDTLRRAFRDRGGRFWGADAERPVIPVLVMDQFEECWTATRSLPEARARAEALIEQLADLVHADAARDPTVRVIFSIREDQLAPLEALRPMFPGLRTSRLRLLPFTRAEAFNVVQLPGRQLIAPGAAEAIVDAFAGSDAEQPVTDPALLSIFCWRLNEDRRERSADQITEDRAIAMRGEFIRQFYDSALAGLPNNQERVARLFIEADLIDAVGFRTSAGFQHAQKQHDLLPSSLEHLINRRLLHPVDRALGQRHVELVHDRLAEVAADLRLERKQRERQEQIAAEREHLREKLTQARRRMALLGLLALVATGALAVALSMRRRAEKAEDHAERLLLSMRASRDEAERRRKESVVAQKKAEVALEQLDMQKTKTELALDSALAERTEANGVIRFLQEDIINSRELNLATRKRINDRIADYRRRSATDPDDVEATNDKTITSLQQAGILMEMGDRGGAITAIEQAVALADAVAEAHPENARARRILSTSLQLRHILGDPLYVVQSLEEEFSSALKLPPAEGQRQSLALKLSASLQTVMEALEGDQQTQPRLVELHRQRLLLWQSILRGKPGDAEVEMELANSHLALSHVLEKSGDARGALRSAEESLEIIERLVRIRATDPKMSTELQLQRERVARLRRFAGP